MNFVDRFDDRFPPFDLANDDVGMMENPRRFGEFRNVIQKIVRPADASGCSGDPRKFLRPLNPVFENAECVAVAAGSAAVRFVADVNAVPPSYAFWPRSRPLGNTRIRG